MSQNAEETFINHLLSQMTFEEKVGQLNQVNQSHDLNCYNRGKSARSSTLLAR